MNRQASASQPESPPRPFQLVLAGETNLPWPVSTLIGREHEITAACELIRRADVRLVTLTGPGGVGKTQLALAIAHKLCDTFADGVVFVPLAPISDPALVATAIARAFDVRDRGTRSIVDGLRVALRKQNALLVLDNFEHLLEASPLVTELLAACPHLKVVVTSRALLHVSGENAFAVPPLEVPDLTRSQSIDEISQHDAVALFVTRAREMNPAFSLSKTNWEAVATICRSLDGLPLAIELAAARTRVLSAQAMCAQMSGRLPLLTGGRRDAPERLQTMRRAIAWSFDLLTPDEQTMFRQLSVFVGGFTFEAAKAVATDQFTLDDLTALVDKSLVQQAEQADGETRFSMLETIREFGLEDLEESGDAEDVRERHALFYLALAEQADQTPITPAKEISCRQLETELPNLRAALEWAEQHNTELLLRLAVALGWYWEFRGSVEESYALVEQTVAASTQVPPGSFGLRAQLLAIAALMESWRGAFERAKVLLDEGETLAHEAGDARALARIALSRGHLSMQRDDWDFAKQHLIEALARSRSLGEPNWIIGALWRLGYVTTGDESQYWFAECLDVARAGGWSLPIAYSLEALGTCARERNDIQQAAILFAEALTLAQECSDPGVVANCLKSLGAVAAVNGRPEQAARLLGATEAIWDRHGFRDQSAGERLRLEQAFAPAREGLSGEVFAAAWAAGRALPLDRAVTEAFEVAQEVTSEKSVSLGSSSNLTPRELAVLRLLVEGHSDKEIAEALEISRRTASKHVESILSKLDVPSRTAAATYATRNGLI